MAILYVYMNGNEVGEYIQRRSGAQEFNYFDAWLENENSIPVSLSLPLTEKSHKGEAVYNYFDNLLPDNLEIRNRIQARFGVKTNQPFDLLSEIGKDCVGAIQLLNQRTKINVKKIEYTKVGKKEIAEDLRNYKTLPLGMSEDKDFRISLAGAQEKTAYLKLNDEWCRPQGATPTTHIFKLPIGRIENSGIDLSESVENEWLCLKVLDAFGVKVAAAEIEDFGDTKILAVERFDREFSKDKSWIIRNPTEDMCQANGVAPGLKYESAKGPGIAKIMSLLESSQKAEEDRKIFMKTVFIFWLMAAIDGHAKNFSIFIRRQGRFHLAPIYDVISAYPIVANGQIQSQKLKMAMALHGENSHYVRDKIMPRHWFDEAKRVKFPESEMQTIIEETISRIDEDVDKVFSSLQDDFPQHIAEPIFDGIKRAAKKF
jgi:serine/threonine-protein kinase HipA